MTAERLMFMMSECRDSAWTRIRLLWVIVVLPSIVAASSCHVGPIVTAGDLDDCSVSYQPAVCRENGTDLAKCPLIPEVLELMHLAADWKPKASDILRAFPKLQVRYGGVNE
jgi:hypothetical protein